MTFLYLALELLGWYLMAWIKEDLKKPRAQAIILGATSIVGCHLIKRLTQKGYKGQAVTRKSELSINETTLSFPWKILPKEESFTVSTPSILFSLVPITVLPRLIAQTRKLTHLVALSTSSTIYKKNSPDPLERNNTEKILQAEQNIRNFCRQKGIHLTIFRPTLIYDPGRDYNVSSIAKFILRFKVFPLIFPANGKRQPIHADDVALALVSAIEMPASRGALYYLPGGETLSYQEMVRRVFAALGRRPLIVYLPIKIAKICFYLWKTLTGTKIYSVANLERMNEDLIFDSSHVRKALGITFRAFKFNFPEKWDER